MAEARVELEALPVGMKGEVLIVDDGSRDGTGRLADSLARRYPDVRVIHHASNRGFSGAMTSCFRGARGDWIFLGPADGQTRLSELPRFLARRDGADIVVGVRSGRPDHVGRKVLSIGFHAIARLLFALPLREFSSVFLFRRALLDAMPFRSRARAATLLPEILFRANARGARIIELDVPQFRRRSGRAKGGQPSVVLLTLIELVRLAPLVRIDELRKIRRAPSLERTT